MELEVKTEMLKKTPIQFKKKAILIDDLSSIVLEGHFMNKFEALQFSDLSTFDLTTAQYETYGTSGSDSITGITSGGSVNDIIFGLGGDDTISAGSGNDYIDGGNGNDSMAGGAGDDIYIVDSIYDVVSENSNQGIDVVYASVSHTLSNNVENLTLTGESNIDATGNTLSNLIIGNSGNNILDGKAGSDRMIGGLGADIYVVDNASDVVIENDDEGIDTVRTSLHNYVLGANLENLTLTGSTHYTGTGNSADNVIIGSTGNNI